VARVVLPPESEYRGVVAAVFRRTPAWSTPLLERTVRRLCFGKRIDRSHPISRTAFVSTYAPRQCGIATFTYDLATTVGEREIVAIHPANEPGPYPAEVRHRIRRDVEADYPYVAQALNDCGVNVVSVQFDPEIWGGEEGSSVLDFVRALQVPFVVTLHSVRPKPSALARRIVTELVASANSTIALSETAARLLAGVYGADTSRVEVIPHGVSALPLVDSDTVKPRLALQGKTVLLSFGLVAPGKGFESVIEAMPAIVKVVPSARYVILGVTSPDADGTEAAAYRAGLEARVAALGLGEQVKFVDRFVGRVELGTWLEAADIIVAPGTDADQTSSGTLAYATGAGRAIVSTPSAYATELLGDGRGKIVAAPSPAALAAAIIELLGDTEARTAMGALAYAHSRKMVWWEVGSRYREVFDRAARFYVERPAPNRRTTAAVAGSR